MPARGEDGGNAGGSAPAPAPRPSGSTGGGGSSGGGFSYNPNQGSSGGSSSSGGSHAAGNTPAPGMVFWGFVVPTPGTTTNTGYAMYYGLTAGQKKNLAIAAKKYGMTPQKFWNKAIYASAASTRNDRQNWLTPWDFINNAAGLSANKNLDLINNNKNNPNKDNSSNNGGGGGGGGPRDYTQTSIQRALTDPDTARAVYNSVFLQELGREATDPEQKAFLKALNQMEKASPSRSVTQTHVSGDGSVSSSDTTQSGGVTNEAKLQMAQDRIQKDKDWGEYTGATRFFNAFVKGVASTV